MFIPRLSSSYPSWLVIPALSLAIAMGLCSGAAAQDRRQLPEFSIHGDAAHPGDETAMLTLIETYRTAWAEQDTSRLMSLHTQDTEWINAYARMFQSREELARFLDERLFPAFDPDIAREESLNMRMVSLRFLGQDGAVIHLVTDGNRGVSRNAGEAMRRTHFHLILQRCGDEWLIVHTAIMDARN